MSNTVNPIPEGMHSLTPHLICANASAAIDFYQRAFNATLGGRMDGPNGSVMHAMMKIGDSHIMLADEMPDWGSVGPRTLKGSPVVLHVYVPDVDAAFAQAVEAGAKVTMPLENMFWGDRYGKLEDPFGHQWSLASHVRDVSMEEMKKASESMCSDAKP